jgi:hypothetical protein
MGIFPWCLARLLLAAHGGQAYLRRGWRRRLLTEVFRFECERLEMAELGLTVDEDGIVR